MLVAFLLATGAVVLSPTNQHTVEAVGACGPNSWLDTSGLSYSNSDYKATRGADFSDYGARKTTHMNFDIQSWRLTGSGGGFISGHCYRRVRISEWTDDQSPGTLWMHIRVWANHNGQCVQLVYDYWPPGQSNVNSSEWKSPWFDYSGCGGPNADGWGFGSDLFWQNNPNSVPYAYANL
jgi:hypothetical protein